MNFPKHQLSPDFERYLKPAQAPPASLFPPRLDRPDALQIKQYFVNSWALYDWLFSSIVDDAAMYMQPDPLRHPLIFYLGHTAAFYMNKMVMAGLIPKGINSHYEKIFARGVDPECPAELRAATDWPDLQSVWNYRRDVFEVILEVIEQADWEQPVHEHHPHWSLMMGLEHDRIHFETSSVLIRQYPVEVVQCPDRWSYAPMNVVKPSGVMIPLEGGPVCLGKPQGFPTFGWDNEYGHLEVQVDRFEISQDLITNGEYLDFYRDGGYADPKNWSARGLAWKAEYHIEKPRFWEKQGDEFGYRAMFDIMNMPLDWPVEVNCLEAEAYCRWKGQDLRLPTEVEFMCMTQGMTAPEEDLWDRGGFNLNLRFGSPCPVGFLEEARTKDGVNDAWGNVWCWLGNDFYPLEGFKTHPLYRDFSDVYMDEKHAMMLGGAWATTGTGASRFYRLWFRRFFYQHAGFRTARSC